MTATVSVELPGNLCRLANSPHVVQLAVSAPVTQRSILDALEQRYPMLQGCVREYGTGKRRAFIRFFACQEDLSHMSPDALLPQAVSEGREPFLIVGAIAGG